MRPIRLIGVLLGVLLLAACAGGREAGSNPGRSGVYVGGAAGAGLGF